MYLHLSIYIRYLIPARKSNMQFFKFYDTLSDKISMDKIDKILAQWQKFCLTKDIVRRLYIQTFEIG